MVDRKFDRWTKSSRSSGNDNCVEVATAADGTIGVRDSKDRLGSILEFTATAWSEFISGVRGGEFDM